MKNITILGINFNWQMIVAWLPQITLLLEHITGHSANEWNTLWQQGASLVMMLWSSVAAGNFSITSTRALALVVALLTTAAPFFNLDFLSLFNNSKELLGLLATAIGMFGVHNGIVKTELKAQVETLKIASKN